MLAILETAGFRIRKGYIIEREYAGEYKYLRVMASKKTKKAIAAMRALNIQTVIPVDMELPKGFRLPDAAAAVRQAAPAAAKQLSKNGQTAAIVSNKVSYETEMICKAILPYTRKLMLRCGSDSRLLAYRVLKEYGVAAIAEPSDEMLSEAEFKADISPEDIVVNGMALRSGNIELKNAPPPPSGAPSALWHNALLESGVFRINKIVVDNGLGIVYNADSEI